MDSLATEQPAASLQPQDLAITMLGAYARGEGDAVWSGGLVTLLGELGFTKAASRVALTRLVRRDLLSRERRGRATYYRLTDDAERLLAEGDARVLAFGHVAPSVDVWTVFWHDIPAAQRVERGRLARRLRILGFGPLQDGLWVCPHDREAEVLPVLEDLEVAERAGIIVGDVDVVGPGAFLRRAWDLGALAARYRAFVDEFAAHARGGNPPRVEDREAFVVSTRLIHLYSGFPVLDPNLPDELMPDPASRRRAVDVFGRADRRLAAPAQRHFDAVTSSAE